MSSTLGEKLRQARQERGISIREVAEQTRISSLYLEAIENDEYKTLPGGIFNKGFLRSYAKYVGVDEQEALQEYSKIVIENEGRENEPHLSYRPEVLTDDRSGSSIIPTVIFAVIILGLMTGGILFLVNYIQNRQSDPAIVANSANTALNTNNSEASNSEPTLSSVPAMETLKVEFQAVGDAVSLGTVTDGKSSEVMISPGKPMTFEPKQSLKLRYSISRARFAHLKINGKDINLPSQPANPKRPVIEFEINSENLNRIWQSGEISMNVSGAADETAITPAATRSAPRPEAKAPASAQSTNSSSPNPTSTPIVVGRPRTVDTNRPSPN